MNIESERKVRLMKYLYTKPMITLARISPMHILRTSSIYETDSDGISGEMGEYGDEYSWAKDR